MISNFKSNGEAQPAAEGTWMRLDYDPATGALKISGSIPSVEVARHMLEQAGWEYEAQWRQNRAKQFALELQDGRKMQALAESIFGKGN